ncbi:hypothetical protein LguiB_009481 [Lonicera macranthoides]
MVVLSLSAPFSIKLSTNSFSFRPQISPSSSSSIIKCSSSLNHFPQITSSTKTLGNGGLGFNFVPPPSAFISATTGPRGTLETGDPMGLLLRERMVFVPSDIDDFGADCLISQLLLLDARDPEKDIRVFVNSRGGSMSATMAIYDVLKLVRADVSTIALGISASTASIILAGGTKGKRYAMPNSRIMIHQPLGGVGGQVLDVEIQTEELVVSKRNVIRIYSEETGRQPRQVEKDLDRDRYLSPIEALEYGIIDGVIDRERIIPLVPVPDRVNATITVASVNKDQKKFLIPDIPDDEIY